VPFTFHFEDYTCPELGTIGEIMLKKNALIPPTDMAPFTRSIHFGTGCCDRLEDCETNKNYKGNGRAVRNVIESSIRAMARRLMSAETRQGKAAYEHMEPEDFDTVTRQLVVAQFSGPCTQHGDIDKITQAVSGFMGVLQGVPSEKREYFLSTVRRIATDSGLVVDYDSMPDVQELGKTCRTGVQGLTEQLVAQLGSMCSASGGVLDKLTEDLDKEQSQEMTKDLVDTLSIALHDQEFMLSLLEATAPAGGSSGAEVAKQCGEKRYDILETKLPLPFDFLFSEAEADEADEEDDWAPEPY
jgi:hypothetical protein